MTFYEAFEFLNHHPKGKFIAALDIDVAMVNPVTKEIDRDPAKNTRLEVWLESGPEVGFHDLMLDCGGETFEEAIIKLASLVDTYYGANRLPEWDDYIIQTFRL